MKQFIILLLCIGYLNASATQEMTWHIDTYYEDINNQLDIDDIIVLDNQNKFKPYTSKHVFNQGYTKSAYWIKVKLNNTTSSHLMRVFQLDHSWLDVINLYLMQNTELLKKWTNGDKKPYNSSDNKLLNPYITLKVPRGESVLYMQVFGEEPLVVPFKIDTAENIDKNILVTLSFFSALYGVLFFMGLYHLLLFFFTRDRNYIFYTLFLFSFIVTNSSYNGFQYQIFLNYSLFLPTFLNGFFIFIYQYLGILFLMSFLKTKQNLPKLHHILRLFIIIGILIQVICLLFDLRHLVQVSAVIGLMIFAPMLFLISLFSLKNNKETNRLFSFGLFFSLIGSTISALSVYGIIPFTFYYFHAVEFGFLIDALLISLALAGKLNYTSAQLTLNIKKLKAKHIEIQAEIQARLISERIAYEHNKLSNLGEMIGNIAHQWRQPLAQLSYSTAYLQEYLDSPDTKVSNKLIKIEETIEFMSDTLNNFQNFYSNDNENSTFSPAEAIKNILGITQASIESNNINLLLTVDDSLQLYGNQNNYAQVLLSIIQNSIQAIVKRDIQDASIKITLKEKDTKSYLTIEDNAKGISIVPIDTIFDIYVSNSVASSTGIGLYLAKKIIVEKFQGTLEVKNTGKGVLFSISI